MHFHPKTPYFNFLWGTDGGQISGMGDKMAYTWKTVAEGIRTREHATRKHGMKPDTYFAIRYYVNGKRKEEGLGWSSQGWTLTKAKSTLAQLRTAQKTGQGEVTLQEKRAKALEARQAEQDKPTIARLWEVYSAALEGRAGIKSDRSRLPIIIEHFGHKTPDQICTAHIAAMRREVEAHGKAPQTVKHTLALLRRIIRYGARCGLCTMPDISKLHFDMPKVDNQKTECLTSEQASVLLAALDADHNKTLAAMMKLCLCTGIRKSAALALQWQDLDFQRGHITLRGEEAKSGKTCTIPMTTAAREVLQTIVMQGSPYLFPNPQTGQPYTDVRRFLNRIRKAANLPEGFRPLHGLRHTYASWLASSGKVDLFTLQKLLTHGDQAMTQRYAHLADEAVKRAAATIDDCLDDIARVAVNAETLPLQGSDIQKPKVIPFKRK